MSRGTASSCHIGRISRGGPGSVTSTRPSGASTSQPGAVPFGLGSASADGIRQACLRLTSGKAIPRRSKRSRSHASISGSTVGSSPTSAATASRVRSSGVGPRPPVVTTRSARPSAASSAPTDRLEVVGDGLQPEHLHAPCGQVTGQLARVRVARVADGDLAADAEQLGGQQGPAGSGGVHPHEGTVRDRDEAEQGRRSAARPRVEAFGTIGSSTAAGSVMMLGALRLRSGRKASEDTMTDLEPSGFSQIDHLLQLVGRTRELLDAVGERG